MLVRLHKTSISLLLLAGSALAQLPPSTIDSASGLEVDAFLLAAADSTVTRPVGIDGLTAGGAMLVVVTPAPELAVRLIHPGGAISTIAAPQPGVSINPMDLRASGSAIVGNLLPKGYWTMFELAPPATDGQYQVAIDRTTFSGQAGIVVFKIARGGIESRLSAPAIATTAGAVPLKVESFLGDTPVPSSAVQLTLVKNVSPAPVVFENLQLMSTSPADSGFVNSVYSLQARRTAVGPETIDLTFDSSTAGVEIVAAPRVIVADEFNASSVASLSVTVRRPSSLVLQLSHMTIRTAYRQLLPPPVLQQQGTAWQGSIQGLQTGDYEVFGGASSTGVQSFSRNLRTTFRIVPQYTSGVTWTESAFDTNGNSLYDGIRFQFQALVVQPGAYLFDIELKSSNGGIALMSRQLSLSPGQQSIPIDFGWRMIRSQLGSNGPFTVSFIKVLFVKPGNEFDPVFEESPNRATGSYLLSQFENDDFRFLETATFSAVNDASGLIQQLRISLGVTGPAMACTLGAGLFGVNGDFVAGHQSNVPISNGVSTVVATFPGEVIRAANVGGPYRIKDVTLICLDSEGNERKAEWKGGAVSGPYTPAAFRAGTPSYNLRYFPVSVAVPSGGSGAASVLSDPIEFFATTINLQISAPPGWQLTYRPDEDFRILPDGALDLSFNVPAGTRAGTYFINTRGLNGAPGKVAVLPVTVTGGPAAPASAANVSQAVSLTRFGIIYDRSAGIARTRVSVTNIDAQPITGPVTLAIGNLVAGTALSNAVGAYNGTAYVASFGGPLNPGQTAVFPLEMHQTAFPSAINYSTAVYSGSFPPSPLTIACPGANGTRLVSYSSSIQSTGGVTPYAFSISQGALPVGLTLNSTTGVVSGNPTQSQVSAFSIKVADSAQTANQTASADCSISVAP